MALTLGSEGVHEGDIELNGGFGFGGDILVFLVINKTKVCVSSTLTNYFLLSLPK